MKKWAYRIGCFIFCCLMAGCAKPDKGTGKEPSGDEMAEAQEKAGKQATFWLYRENEVLNRYVAGAFVQAQGQMKGTKYEQYYPEISIKMVDKSYLTPEQYRKELQEALDAGNGPDLIFMDACNGVSPEDMADSGKLAPLEKAADWYGSDVPYIAGTLEAGQGGGRQYAVPVSLQCPVLFGIAEDMEDAGIDVEKRWGSLQELLEALLAAHEKTGKRILEDTQAVDWLEQYYTDAQDTELKGLLEKVRAACGTDGGPFAAYHALDEGTALLCGCGVTDVHQMGLNLAMLPEGIEPAFLYVPASDGRRRAVVTQAVGVNADSAYVKELDAALSMYKSLMVTELAGISPIADKDYWDMGLDAYILCAKDHAPARDAAVIADKVPDKVKSAFRETVCGQTEEAVYAQPSRGGLEGDGGAAGDAEEKRVLTALYADGIPGMESSLTKWLEQAAEKFNSGSGEFYVQPIKVSEPRLVMALLTSYMFAGGTEPDIVLYSERSLNGGVIEEAWLSDLSDLLEEYAAQLDFLPEGMAGGVRKGKRVIGLPYAAEEYGVWYKRDTLEKAGLAESWKPQDLGALAEGARQMKELGGVETGLAWGYDPDCMKALFAFLEPEQISGSLKQAQDGSWRMSEDAWETYISLLVEMRDEGLSAPVGVNGGLTEEQAAQGLADGTVGMVLGGRSFEGWYGDEESQGMAFAPLTPMASVWMFAVSESCAHKEAAVEFWLGAMRSAEYGGIGDADVAALDSLSEGTKYALPCQGAAGNLEDLWNRICLSEQTAEELSGKEYWLYDIQE